MLKKKNNSSTALSRIPFDSDKWPNAMAARSSIALGKTLRTTCLLQWILLFLVLLPFVAISQEIKSIQELLDKSDIVVDAQVISNESKWVLKSKGGTEKCIFTSTKLKVLQTIKGVMENNEFAFYQLGGKVNEITFDDDDFIGFVLNERAILFLKKDPLRLFAGRLSKDEIHNGKLNFGTEQIDPDRYINVLKQSINDKSVLPKFIDEIKKEGEERKSMQYVAPVFTPNNPHPKLIAVPIPKESAKDTIKQERPKFEEKDRSTQGDVK